MIEDPDNFGEILQKYVFDKLYANGNKSKCKDLLKGCILKTQSMLYGFFPKEYIKKAADLMIKRAKGELPYGGFKWGMVAIYYELKELKKKQTNIDLDYEFQTLLDWEEVSMDDLL